jgi:hypothetical protein
VRSRIALASILSIGCALAPACLPPAPTPVWVRSHNQNVVDVYLLCGRSDAHWLASVPENGSDAFEIPAGQARCAPGLNFFLVVQDQRQGYWVGPLRPQRGELVELVIEKYAGLSSARIRYDRR